MLLRIQEDETLRSYIERSIYLGLREKHVDLFKRFSEYSIGSGNIRAIASEFGWKGCYGFNRLIHLHTKNYLRVVFCDFKDYSYSGRSYISKGDKYSSNTEIIGFCPKCAKEDLSRLGFSYWRRLHCDGAKVCAKHNVILLKACPFCGECFSTGGHGLNVMWGTCGGRHISDCVPTLNCEPRDLRRAEFLTAVCKFNYQICGKTASAFLLNKILKLDCFSAVRADGSNISKEVALYEFELLLQGQKKIVEFYKDESSFLFDLILFFYKKFELFVVDLQSVNCDFRDIDFGWATFRASGDESPHYVEEDYVLGVAQWSCPHPSEDSRKPSSTDGYWNRKPIIYPCCNFVSDCSKDLNLTSVRVRLAPPAVPRLGLKHSPLLLEVLQIENELARESPLGTIEL